MSTGQPDSPDWWVGQLRPGQAVTVDVYGERMTGKLLSLKDRVIEVHVPISQQSSMLRASTAQGRAEISIDGGAAIAAVSCWPVGDSVRMRVIGPVELVQRRMHVRVALDVPVVLTWATGETGRAVGGTERVMGRSTDLSIGGMRVQPANIVWPSPGAEVTVLIDLPGGAVQATAESLGKTPDYGLRLQFSSVSPAAAAAIADCVQSHGKGRDGR